ncbi:MAG: very short patch repair endonuclease [Pseudomonadota bacterium]|nr:very short patch repair endonuclease [Pseudomonadota bacterium]
MPDVVTPAVRSRMMAGIRGKDTKPEMILRRELHRRGLRYRLHGKLPGRPDLVFPGRKAVIFVHGCFWHGHDCALFRWPGSRKKFWKDKISGNRARDIRTLETLKTGGWRILVVWECVFKGPGRWPLPDIIDRTARWLEGSAPFQEMRGSAPS